jgi:hypothetical protein
LTELLAKREKIRDWPLLGIAAVKSVPNAA